MAVSKVTLRWAFKAATDLSNSQYTVVKLTENRTLEAAVSGSLPALILEEKPKEGEYGNVVLAGVQKAKVGSEVKAGQLVGAKNDGTIQPVASGQYVIGLALETGAAGTYIPVLVHPPGAKA